MSPGIPTRLLATQSDERLLALVRQGHERAFEALVHRYRKPLLGYCRRLRLSDARAEDIVQLALLKTWIAVREGAEVRELKAWLYRVVHNTAVNALRDAAHDGEPLADPTQEFGSHSPHLPVDESRLDSRLEMRETLAEVAALPPLQREVMVRTAVAGHSHEQVASDLGITNGAVRGLLYRARSTLRTAITALTPPQLLGWLAGRSDQGGPGPERLTELASGGGAAGLGGAGVGGLLLKGGVVAITAGTVITGAAVVHLGASAHHRDRHRTIAAASPSGAGAAIAEARSEGPDRGLAAADARRGGSAHGNRRRHVDSGRRSRAGARAPGGGGSAGARGDTPAAGEPAPRSTARSVGGTRRDTPPPAPVVSPAPSSNQGSAGQAEAGSGQSGGSNQAGEAGAGSGGPVGSVASSGSSAGGASSGGASEGQPSGGGQQSSGSGGESGSGSSEGSSGQGSSSGSSDSESSNSGSSGSLVGTVVHEVGSILEHLLH